MKRWLVVVIALVLLALATGAALAVAPAPEGPFNTAFRVQNLGSADATCVYEFYDTTGSVAYTSASEVISVGDSLYVYVPNVGVADGQYSAVVSCDQPVGAVVNFSDADSGAAHNGIASGEVGTTWFAPGIYDNFYGFYSNIYAQNTTNAPITITAEIYEAGVATPVLTQTQTNVAPYAAVVFDQSGQAALQDNVAYSAKISADGDIAVIVNIYGEGGVEDQLYSYNPFASGATTAYAPVIMKNYYGYNTALTVQNMGSTTTTVTVTYGTGVTETASIAANASHLFYTPASPLSDGTLTGATVQSDGQPIVLLVNESTSMNRAASYSGFATGSTTVRAPIVMRRYYNYNTSITCQNVGTVTTTMTIAYGGISGTEEVADVAPGGTALFYQPASTLISDNFIGSATITASQPIICVVNEDMNEAPYVNQKMDQLYAYNAISQ